MADFYHTKVIIEVDLVHMQEPKMAIGWLEHRIKCPVSPQVKVISAKSDYQVHKSPKETMEDVVL